MNVSSIGELDFRPRSSCGQPQTKPTNYDRNEATVNRKKYADIAAKSSEIFLLDHMK